MVRDGVHWINTPPAHGNPAPASMRIHNARAFQTAIWLSIDGELGKHAFSQGMKAVNRYERSQDSTEPAPAPAPAAQEPSLKSIWDAFEGSLRKNGVRQPCMARGGGLHAHPEYIAALCQLTHGVILEETAAVYLAALVEYIAAEVLELAGNECKTGASTIVTARHVTLAIRGDEELDLLFPGWIANGGVVAHVYKAVTDAASAAPSEGTFDEWFCQRLEATTNRIAIDPRDGKHVTLVDGELRSIPGLDLACKHSEAARLVAARATLDAEGHRLLQAALGSREQRRRHQLTRIRNAQRQSHMRCIPAAAMARLVYSITDDHNTSRLWSEPAFACMHEAAEAYLTRVFEGAALKAAIGKRMVVLPSDIDMRA